MAAKKHTLLWIAGLGGGGWAAYEFLYKPWKAAQDAAVAAASATPLLTYGGGSSAGSAFTTGSPFTLSPLTSGGTGSIQDLNQGQNIGGPVGTCMQRKGWTQSQCVTRLNSIQTAWSQGQARLANWDADVSQAQAALAANQAALAQAQAALNQAHAANDAAGVITWTNAVNAHTSDINDLNSRLANNVQNKAAIQNEMAGLASDFQALTGLTLA